ncbi:EscU/YscU/HrcU family type III secretion system export apparatus switch protein [Thiothrix lacustris]|uniref:EscU/YscU/HrcU family type III secretion system export apparatus switch protein n=1 Tax=Thiothrix lacustris TaxID=525917 RepID=UPI0027E545CE|nr:EscU/YscU/HrcU family type III secretion system export apparatus switch protein [Thiothrix lacustris]WMP16353.1 EscU/YscU/HrcU family type III secretion system export apparatus switch protein [Thiothrix lacustris]
MSEDSSQEKTEEPSSRKLKKAREKGQVARSNDVSSALTMLFVILYFFAAWDWIVAKFMEMFDIIPMLYTMPFPQALEVGFKAILENTLYSIAIPFAMMTVISGILANIIQIGFVFSFEPIIPNLSKISFSSGFKRIFSAKQFITTLIALFKTLIVGIILFFVVRIGISELFHAIKQCNVACQKEVIEHLVRQLMLFIVPIMIIMAVVDFIFQRQQFTKDQRMTKEDVKKEMKDIFGDPHVRAARQGIRRELSEQDIQKRIRTARLLILDMGIAIALQYEQGVTPLPIIVAIGKNNMSKKMVEIASLENVPLVSDPALVEDLLSEGKIDQYIPEKTINKIANLLRQTQGQVKQ